MTSIYPEPVGGPSRDQFWRTLSVDGAAGQFHLKNEGTGKTLDFVSRTGRSVVQELDKGATGQRWRLEQVGKHTNVFVITDVRTTNVRTKQVLDYEAPK